MKLPDALKQAIQRWLWPLMPGWPDEGRRMVQGPSLRALLARAAQSRQFPRVFNAGSGEGGYSPLLLALPGVETVVESDYAFRFEPPRRIDAKQLFFCASLESIPLPDRTFDLVLCTEVLEHIRGHEQALDEMTRVTKPGGWLLITVPTPPAVKDSNHVREGYRLEELSALLAQRGFQVIESRVCMYFFFRFLLRNWSRMPWCPRFLVRALSALDKRLRIGPPMDLMMLAKLPDETMLPVCSAVNSKVHLESAV